MKTEFMVAITQLSAEKNLSKDVVLAAVESALVSAYKKDTFDPNQDISVKISTSTGAVKVYVKKTVVETVTDKSIEISLGEAQKIDKNVKIDDIINIEATPPNAGRIAAQTARQVILQRLHEAEHHAIFEEFTCKEGDVLTGVIQRITPDQIYVDLGKAEAILLPSEQVHNERYRVGQRLKLYLLEVIKAARGPQILVSRSHRNLLRRLFELEVPEIHSGIVELKSVAREAGHRSKVAVAARQDGIDPVGCCVGLRGIRIQNIVNELNDEKIDVVQWVDEPKAYISNALSPAQVSNVELNEEEGTALVSVPDKQLSLAIGKEGQNARLAAKLTGWRIDIKSTSVIEAEKKAVAKKPVAEIEEPASDIKEPTADVEEAIPEVIPDIIPEFIDDVLAPKETEEQVEEEKETITAADLEVILAKEILSTEQKAAPQIRFAEDILPSKAGSSKKKRDSKKETDVKETGAKPKKARSKRVSYHEDEDGEDFE
jgi:N utilization substance protein A